MSYYGLFTPSNDSYLLPCCDNGAAEELLSGFTAPTQTISLNIHEPIQFIGV